MRKRERERRERMREREERESTFDLEKCHHVKLDNVY
jgi:hypothetical protein